MARTDDQIMTQLLRTRDNLLDRRLELLQKPKPTYDIDGQTVKWNEYLDLLNKSMAAIDEQIKEQEGPYELETTGYT
jgi:hypothetical protein